MFISYTCVFLLFWYLLQYAGDIFSSGNENTGLVNSLSLPENVLCSVFKNWLLQRVIAVDASCPHMWEKHYQKESSSLPLHYDPFF